MNISKDTIFSTCGNEDLNETDDSMDHINPFDMRLFWKNIDSYGFDPKFEEEAKKNEMDPHFVMPKSMFLTSSKSLDKQLELDQTYQKQKKEYSKFYEQKKITPKSEYEFLKKMSEKEEKFNIKVLSQIETMIKSNEKIKKRGRKKKNESSKKSKNSMELSLEKPILTLNDRLDILFGQICDLQLKQLAECICGVLRKKDNKTYKILMDLDSKIKSYEITKEQYKNFIKYRDPLNSISDYDLFQEKTHCYFNTDTKAKTFIDYKDVDNTDTENKRNNRIKMRAILYRNSTKTKKSECNNYLRKEEYHTGKKVKVDYFYCHHCKQRKPEEVTIQCKSSLIGDGFCHRPHKIINVNGCTVIRNCQSLIIKNFDDDPKEFLEASKCLQKKEKCQRFFCQFCLKGSYDTLMEKIRCKNEWICPYCSGTCYCSRCLRQDKILQLTAYYLSLGGNIKDLYDYLTSFSPILDLLFPHLFLSRVYIIINEKGLTASELIDRIRSPPSSSLDDLIQHDEHITHFKKLENELNDKKEEFEESFNRAFYDLFELKSTDSEQKNIQIMLNTIYRNNNNKKK